MQAIPCCLGRVSALLQYLGSIILILIPWQSKKARLLHRQICWVGEELGETVTFQTLKQFTLYSCNQSFLNQTLAALSPSQAAQCGAQGQ